MSPTGAIGVALTRARDWLVVPAEEAEAAPVAPAAPSPTASIEQLTLEPPSRAEHAEEARVAVPADAAVEPSVRPIVAVVALAERCGATTVARWLAAELAARDADGAAVVLGALTGGAAPAVRSAGAGRLARALLERDLEAAEVAGRICLVDEAEHSALTVAATCLAPVVIDGGHGLAAGPVASMADHTVLVASPAVEPSLAAVVAASLAQSGPEPIVVVNRADEPGRWAERPALLLPSSRIGARLATAGRPARGSLGAAMAELADACEGSLWA
jgi:hypothetical protein